MDQRFEKLEQLQREMQEKLQLQMQEQNRQRERPYGQCYGKQSIPSWLYSNAESQRKLEERYKWLEEKFKAMETTDFRCGVNAKDLSLVPDLVLLLKFKVPEFEKYNGTSCPEAHI
ncbi:WAT1-related protein [Gossypium australe]|uniref:WAT1-related protein n=1 Tax=Gossypium australe TaxID=47621 RepID=A0A5B6WAV7_9ROSI|nr:WAT1-related protein [Gossypium australe]